MVIGTTSSHLPKLQCPMCGADMQRKLSSSGAGVVIDICQRHGTFYDGGELQRLR